jgi:ssDNA-binding Zn-finger/Zn-ribbon topoisomerase 1
MSQRSSLHRDPRWQRKRLEIMKRDGFRCVACGDANSTLNVHHGRYESESFPPAPWKTADEYMQTLCEKCHTALGNHPKGGIMYKMEDGETFIVVEHCPVCGLHKWRDKGSYVKCENCGEQQSVFGHSVAVGIMIRGAI